MEEFRSILCDRFVLTLINTKTVRKDSFMKGDDGAVLLNDKGRKIFFNNWQNRKRELITHPFLKEKMEWGFKEDEDSLRFYYLGNKYDTKIEHFGVKSTYEPEGVLII